MDQIRPSSDLRSHYNEIASLCRETKEPVFITVHGKGDTAILDIHVYQKMEKELALYRMLALSEEQFRRGESLPAGEAFDDILRELEGEQ